MNIDLELYKIFYYVAKNHNITKTANELHVTQPSISKAIKNLEGQLGCTLFVRNKYGVDLTEEGKVFYNKIKSAFSIIKSAEDSLENMLNLDEGIINIGASNTITKKFLLPYLVDFHEEFPNIKINIVTNTAKVNFNNVRNGIVDILIINLPYPVPNDFEVIPLCDLHDIFVANKEYEFLKNKELSIKDLNNYPLILLSKGSNTRYFLDDYTASIGFNLEAFSEPTSFSLVVEFAKLGLGIGYVTKEYLDNELDGDLFEIKIKEKIPNRQLGIVIRKNQELSHASKMFLEILKEKKS